MIVLALAFAALVGRVTISLRSLIIDAFYAPLQVVYSRFKP